MPAYDRLTGNLTMVLPGSVDATRHQKTFNEKEMLIENSGVHALCW